MIALRSSNNMDEEGNMLMTHVVSINCMQLAARLEDLWACSMRLWRENIPPIRLSGPPGYCLG